MSEMKMTPEQLDRLLEQMAEETPEMPADFHAQWVRAVKAEAAKREQNEDRERAGDQEQSRTQEQAGDQTAEDFPAQKKRRLSPAWSRLISAAAVMIFLVGGTLLSRDFLKQEIRIAATARAPEKKAAAVPNTAKDAGQAAGAADEMLIEEAAEAVMEEAGAVNASAAFGSAAMMEDADLAYDMAGDQMEEAAEEEMEETITLSASSARKSVTAA